MLQPLLARRRRELGQRHRDDQTVQRLAQPGALQQVEKALPTGAIDRLVGILRRIPAGGVDQHRLLGEPPLAQPRPADAGHRVLPHLGGERKPQPGS